jgi:hypothetical protein
LLGAKVGVLEIKQAKFFSKFQQNDVKKYFSGKNPYFYTYRNSFSYSKKKLRESILLF